MQPQAPAPHERVTPTALSRKRHPSPGAYRRWLPRFEHLDDAEIRLLRIALNRLTEQSDWDKVELAAEFGELLSLEIDLAYEITGFETPEIDNLIQAADAIEVDEDDTVIPVGDLDSAIARLGEIWQLDNHRVPCGSSLKEQNLEKLLDGEQAAMVLTDQPFNVKIGGNVSGLGKTRHREFL